MQQTMYLIHLWFMVSLDILVFLTLASKDMDFI